MLFAFASRDATHARARNSAPTEGKSWRRKRVIGTRRTRGGEPLLSSLVPVDGAALSRALDKRTKTQSESSPGGRRRHDRPTRRSSDAIAGSRACGRDADGLLNTHAAPDETLDTPWTARRRERDVRRFIFHTGRARREVSRARGGTTALPTTHTHRTACWRSCWNSSEKPRRDASARRRWPPCFRTRRENEWTFRGRGEWARFRGAAARGATLLPLRSPTLLKCAASRTRLLYPRRSRHRASVAECRGARAPSSKDAARPFRFCTLQRQKYTHYKLCANRVILRREL